MPPSPVAITRAPPKPQCHQPRSQASPCPVPHTPAHALLSSLSFSRVFDLRLRLRTENHFTLTGLLPRLIHAIGPLTGGDVAHRPADPVRTGGSTHSILRGGWRL